MRVVERYSPAHKVTTKYTASERAIRDIQKAASWCGSVGRALQVASEILMREPGTLDLSRYDGDDQRRLTFTLLPRTKDLIDKLIRVYGDPAKAIAACACVLREIK